MENKVIWRKISSILTFEEFQRYEVSNTGLVRNKKGLTLKQSIKKDGYHIVSLYSKKLKRCKSLNVHRLVCLAFLKNEDLKPQVNHIDGDKSNNSIFNLEWVTAKENINHSIDIGLRKATPEKAIDSVKIKIMQIDKKTDEVIKIWDSIQEASEFTGIDFRNIAHVVRGEPSRKTAGGYKWKKVD